MIYKAPKSQKESGRKCEWHLGGGGRSNFFNKRTTLFFHRGRRPLSLFKQLFNTSMLAPVSSQLSGQLTGLQLQWRQLIKQSLSVAQRPAHEVLQLLFHCTVPSSLRIAILHSRFCTFAFRLRILIRFSTRLLQFHIPMRLSVGGLCDPVSVAAGCFPGGAEDAVTVGQGGRQIRWRTTPSPGNHLANIIYDSYRERA